eukprot:TRINITY_DN12164_c0_g2_i1.p2 TRINITY_DN12164_c0_g2~~TRINITY_DN12164_c0_g2_i1.p2  ORF type:complete len:237 (+),score=61.37 TRINITY_DN12164_c0_g2_i1:96-806(+)
MADDDVFENSVDISDMSAFEVEGEIDQEAINDHNMVQTTLDEPVWDTIKRDLLAILTKFYYVFLPHQGKALLNDWDLWGPMALTMTLALLLRASAGEDSQSEVFAGVFFIICIGAVVVTVNNQLLGGTLTVFQGLCVLGYCILPLVVACLLLKLVAGISSHLAFRGLVVLAAMSWSIYASIGFIAKQSPVKRRALVLYPIILYYIVIGWLVLNDNTHATAVKPAPASTTTARPDSN